MDDPRNTLEIDGSALELEAVPAEPDVPPPAHNTGRPVSRHGIAIIVGGLLVVAAAIFIGYRVITPNESEVYRAAVDGAAELRQTAITARSVTEVDVRAAVFRGRSGRPIADRLRVVEAGRSDTAGKFEVTNRHGDYPTCLTVRSAKHDAGSPWFPSVDVTKGRCLPGAA
jgi:hypothetical protein